MCFIVKNFLGFPISKIRHFVVQHKVVLLFLLGLWVWQFILMSTWLYKDQSPPQWDQSVHLSTSLHYKHALSSLSLTDMIVPPRYPGHPPYPPFVHYAMVPLLFMSDWTGIPPEDAVTLVNLFFIVLLSFGAFLLVQDWRGHEAGVCAAFLTGLCPPLLGYSHEPLVDLGLAAWVVMAYACWQRSDHFYDRSWSLGCGAAFGLGLLSKWTFMFYVAPILWDMGKVVFKKYQAPMNKNGWGAIGIGALLAGPWYSVNIFSVLPRIVRAASLGAQEGDPSVWSLASWAWYPKLLWHDLFLWGIVLGISGLVCLVFFRPKHFWVLAWWFLGAYVVWSLVSNKNPRDIFPALLVFPLAAAFLPKRVNVMAAGLSVVFSWLVTWNYVGHAMPAQPFPWPLEAIVQKAAESRGPLSDPLSVLSLPANHDYLNGNNLRWTVEKMGLDDVIVPRTKISRLGQFSEFVLMKTGALGPAGTIARHEEVRKEILAKPGWFGRAFVELERWALPDKSEAVLFHRRKNIKGLAPYQALSQVLPHVSFEGLRVYEDRHYVQRANQKTAERTWLVVRARKMVLKSLELTNVRLALNGFLAVENERREPCLLRLHEVFVESARISEKAVADFIRSRAKNVKNVQVEFLEKNQLSVQGQIGVVPLRVLMELGYHQEDTGEPFLRVKLVKLKAGGVPLPLFFLGGLCEKSVRLTPSRGMPFFVYFSGLSTVGHDLEIKEKKPGSSHGPKEKK